MRDNMKMLLLVGAVVVLVIFSSGIKFATYPDVCKGTWEYDCRDGTHDCVVSITCPPTWGGSDVSECCVIRQDLSECMVGASVGTSTKILTNGCNYCVYDLCAILVSTTSTTTSTTTPTTTTTTIPCIGCDGDNTLWYVMGGLALLLIGLIYYRGRR